MADHGLLAGNRAQVLDGAVDGLGVGRGLADAHVHDDLLELGDHHDVLVVVLLVKLVTNLVDVLRLQAGHLCHVLSPILGFDAPGFRPDASHSHE